MQKYPKSQTISRTLHTRLYISALSQQRGKTHFKILGCSYFPIIISKNGIYIFFFFPLDLSTTSLETKKWWLQSRVIGACLAQTSGTFTSKLTLTTKSARGFFPLRNQPLVDMWVCIFLAQGPACCCVLKGLRYALGLWMMVGGDQLKVLT